MSVTTRRRKGLRSTRPVSKQPQRTPAMPADVPGYLHRVVTGEHDGRHYALCTTCSWVTTSAYPFEVRDQITSHHR